jgi:hypothetical protein
MNSVIHVLLRTECPECGAPLVVPGVRSSLICAACSSTIPCGLDFWRGVYFRLNGAFPGPRYAFNLASSIAAELPIYARFDTSRLRVWTAEGRSGSTGIVPTPIAR